MLRHVLIFLYRQIRLPLLPFYPQPTAIWPQSYYPWKPLWPKSIMTSLLLNSMDTFCLITTSLQDLTWLTTLYPTPLKFCLPLFVSMTTSPSYPPLWALLFSLFPRFLCDYPPLQISDHQKSILSFILFFILLLNVTSPILMAFMHMHMVKDSQMHFSSWLSFDWDLLNNQDLRQKPFSTSPQTLHTHSIYINWNSPSHPTLS